MEHGYPTTAQLLSQLFDESPQRDRNATRLITIIRIVQNDVLVSPSQLRHANLSEAGDDWVSVLRTYRCLSGDQKCRGDAMLDGEDAGEIQGVIANAVKSAGQLRDNLQNCVTRRHRT